MGFLEEISTWESPNFSSSPDLKVALGSIIDHMKNARASARPALADTAVCGVLLNGCKYCLNVVRLKPMQVEIHTLVSQNNILNAEKKSDHVLSKDLPFGAKAARPATLQYDRILLEFARRHSSC